jgi:type II secretory pathway component GspD/PulD (secretin)
MKKPLVLLLASSLLLTASSSPVMSFLSVAQAQQLSEKSADKPASMNTSLMVPNGERKISLEFANTSIRTVLNNIARAGQLNLMMDESVAGNISTDLNNITINQALESVAALGNLLIVKQRGNIYLAIGKEAADTKGISRQLSKVVKIHYSTAARIATLLNQSLFSTGGTTGSSGSGGTALSKAQADARTNSVLIVGTQQDIDLAEAAVAKLDKPRESKTFYLSHANALDVATMLASSIYNEGAANFSSGSSSSSGSGGGAASNITPATIRVEKQNLTEGTGVNSFGNADSGNASAGFSDAVTLRGYAKTSDTASVSPQGVLIVPDTRQNSITLMGTAEQIALADTLIPTLDAQAAQVSIEASLIEITDTGLKELGTSIGISDGKLQSGFNNTPVEGTGNSSGVSGLPAGTGLIGLPTVDSTDVNAYGRSGFVFTTNPLSKQTDYLTQLRALVTTQKAKVLANPTIVATHDTESIISIVDEVVRRVVTQVDPSGFSTQTVELGEAGIVMDILPKVGNDGSVSMRLRPSVTSVLSQNRDASGNLITLLSKRDVFTQNVRVKDGETLVIGGLIQERDSLRKDKLPALGDLPIVGAMFRSSVKSGQRSEVVMLITPHILSKTQQTPVTSSQTKTPFKSSMAGDP